MSPSIGESNGNRPNRQSGPEYGSSGIAGGVTSVLDDVTDGALKDSRGFLALRGFKDQRQRGARRQALVFLGANGSVSDYSAIRPSSDPLTFKALKKKTAA